MGGGHGPLSPGLGLGADNLVEARVLTAKGELVTASTEENSDLFWALRFVLALYIGAFARIF